MDQDRRDPQQRIGRRKLESSVQTILASLNDVILELDRSGCILFVSKTLTGFDMEDLLGRDFGEWASPPEHALMRETLEKVFTSGESAWYQTRSMGMLGDARWYESRLSPVVRDGKVRSVILITTNITERKLAELEAQKQAELIQLFYNLPFVGMSITDPQTRKRIKVNDKLCEMMGYSREELLLRGWEELTHPEDLPGSRADFERVLRGEADGYTQEKRFIHRNGSIIHAAVDVHCARNAQGKPDYFVATIQDITARKEQDARIRHMAHHDLLTDLPNRGLLSDRLDQALLRAQRNQTRLAVLFMDLDRFKPVNDAWGHEAGDQLLRAVAQRLRECVRAADTVSRMGGDEFVLLLSPIEQAQDAVAVAEKIRTAINQPFALAEAHLAHIASSIGIALYPEHGNTAEELLRNADDAMYAAKEAGRDRVQLFQTVT
jgi:diguanylate cyclase (GGDEF)-like protein/PAS domain S-box-containing protein